MARPLYKLTEHYKTIEELLDNPDFNPDSVQESLANIQEEIEEKVENVAKIILSLKADAEVVREEQNRLKSRREALVNKANWLREYLASEMKRVNINKVKREILTVSLQATPPGVDVNDPYVLPEEFQKIYIEANKAKILEHFKKTGEIPVGSDITTGRSHVVIR